MSYKPVKQRHSLIEDDEEIPPKPPVRPVPNPSVKPSLAELARRLKPITKLRLPVKVSGPLRQFSHEVWTGERSQKAKKPHKAMVDMRRINPIFKSNEELKYHQKKKGKL